MEIHLDPLGGLSGDMFAAAMLDAFPEHWPAVAAAVASLGFGPEASCRLLAHRDRAGLTGRRFVVAAEQVVAPAITMPGSSGLLPSGEKVPDRADEGFQGGPRTPHPTLRATFSPEGRRVEPRSRTAVHSDAHAHPHAPHLPHEHRRWRDIREMLAQSRLPAPARDHAIGIFALLAAAEAEVHGVAEDAVSFHEVGAVDSIVDIVAAGQILALVGAAAWSAAPLPLGSGRVRTQHGILPVPAPATALLLRGLPVIDDGVPGERVTPTGAAIARHLLSGAAPARAPRRLARSGTGFGSRELDGLSNCLRVLAFDPEPAAGPAGPGASAGFAHRELAVVTFEVDDLSAEDLASGLDHIRALPGIHDVIQSVAFGKKGRMATQVQVLAAPEALDAAIRACFTETTTIGLRFHTVRGAVLRRIAGETEVEGRTLRVKLVERPGGRVTGKAEAADVAGDPGHAARVTLRREAEAAALRTDAHRFGREPEGGAS